MPEAMKAEFDRDDFAGWYAHRHHMDIDDAIVKILYLPTGAPPDEIRSLEVNTMIPETTPLEPIDFGVDIDSATAHTLYVLGVTPAQFESILREICPSPPDGRLTVIKNSVAVDETMNAAQELWSEQAKSDYELPVQLRAAGAHECHLLHYLRMATEKLSKAYLWRSGKAPPKTRTGFVRFLRALLDRRTDLDRIAKSSNFGRTADLETWVREVRTLAYSLQSIAPAEAGDGPNPEYP